MTKCAQSHLSYETAIQLWDLNTMMKSAQAQQVRKGNGSWATYGNNVANNVQDLWNGVSNGISNGARSVGNAVGSAWNAAGNALDKATTGDYNTQDGNWFERGANRAQNAYENAGNYLSDAAEGAGMMARDAVTAGKNFAKDQANMIGNYWADKGNQAVQSGKDMVNSAVNAGKSLWNRFKGWGKDKYNQIADAYNNGRQAVEGLGQTAVDAYRLRQNGARQQADAARIQRAKAELEAARGAQFSHSSPRTQQAAQRAHNGNNMTGN